MQTNQQSAIKWLTDQQPIVSVTPIYLLSIFAGFVCGGIMRLPCDGNLVFCNQTVMRLPWFSCDGNLVFCNQTVMRLPCDGNLVFCNQTVMRLPWFLCDANLVFCNQTLMTLPWFSRKCNLVACNQVLCNRTLSLVMPALVHSIPPVISFTSVEPKYWKGKRSVYSLIIPKIGLRYCEDKIWV